MINRTSLTSLALYMLGMSSPIIKNLQCMKWCRRIHTVCYIWGCAHLQSRAVWCHWRGAHTASPRRVGTPM